MKCINKPWSIPGCSDAAVAELAEQQRLRLISPRKGFRDAIEASTDPALLNYRLIAQWLGESIPDTRSLTLALDNSLCFGLYRNGRQIGFARVVTDMAETWVIRNLSISPEYRFIGLGSWLLHCCLTHPGTRGCRSIIAMGEPVPERIYGFSLTARGLRDDAERRCLRPDLRQKRQRALSPGARL
nr:GNAT family N-acetyltransferase [Pantoea allii]